MKYRDVVTRARAARAAALARPELRFPFGYTPVDRAMPPEEQPVTAWAQTAADRSPYLLPFSVVLRGGKWFNATHDRPIEVPVVGWCHRGTP